MVNNKYLVGDRKVSCPSGREKSVDQKTQECKGKRKMQGEKKKNVERAIGKSAERKIQK